MRNPTYLAPLILVTVTLLAFAAQANADTPIIVDSLISTSSTSIVGRVPTVDTPGNAWNQDMYAGWVTDTNGASTPSGDGVGDAYISIPTVTSGGIYTYQVTEAGLVGGEAQMGFINLEGEGGTPRVYNSNGPVITLDGGGDFYTSNGEVRPGDTGYPGVNGATGPNVLELILNTTDATAWTVTTVINGVDVGTAGLANTSDLDALEISEGGGDPKFTNLSYSELTVPEPSSLALMLAGLVTAGFIFRCRLAAK